jgi:uncharacterized membrane protein YdjX (TVP38/TMEM64 family)
MPSQRPSITRKILTVLLLGALVLWAAYEFKHYLPDLEVWIAGLGVCAPVVFVLVFTLLTPLLVSVDALCFAAGIVFPLVIGELAIVIATYLSSALIFFLGKYLVRARVLGFMATHPRFAIVDKIASSDHAFKLMLLLRLTPLPFAPLSYALSVTGVKFWPYLLATSGILIYNGSLVYLGYATKHIAVAAGGNTPPHIAEHTLMIGGGLLLLAVLMYIVRMAKQALLVDGLEKT